MIFLFYAIKLAETQNLYSAPVRLLTLKGGGAWRKDKVPGWAALMG